MITQADLRDVEADCWLRAARKALAWRARFAFVLGLGSGVFVGMVATAVVFG